MGSFNETCALSNYNIPYGTPVRLFFFEQNPYNSSGLGRGCYCTDYWQVRTPPLKGVYNDYGKCEIINSFEEDQLCELISDLFHQEVVELPFGFNTCHDVPVSKSGDIFHYLEAAWEGRLFVYHNYHPSLDRVPDNFPTWQSVHKILTDKKLKITAKDGNKGYNAQQIDRGIVYVEYTSYSDTSRQISKARKVLEEHYDCKPVKDGNDAGLLVVTKGAFENPLMLTNIELLQRKLSEFPDKYNRLSNRKMSVLAVMIREDVWQTYLNIVVESEYEFNRIPPVEELEERIREAVVALQTVMSQEASKSFSSHMRAYDKFRDLRISSSLKLGTIEHLKYAIEEKKVKPEVIDSLIRKCAEVGHVELVLERIHQTWQVPPLGGQDPEWELQVMLKSRLLEIGKLNLLKFDDEDDE